MNPLVFTNIIFLSTLVLVVHYASSDYVPVYMWETQKGSGAVPALGRISSETFKEVLKSKLVNNPKIVVYAEENLSTEDFIGHGELGRNTFENLSDLESTAQVNYLPYVENPIDVVKQLANNEVTQVSVSDFQKQPTFPKTGVLIIDLNDAKDNEDRNDMLKRHDKTIGSIHKTLQKEEDNILSLFTGLHSSWIVPGDIVDTRQKRHLLADESEAPSNVSTSILLDTNNAILYVNNPASYKYGEVSVEMLKDYVAESVNDTGKINVTFTSPDKKIELKMHFSNSSGYWIWYNLTLKNDGNESWFQTNNISAPIGFSYHCINQIFYTKGNKAVNITFPGLQLEPFFDKEVNSSSGFDDAYDCVGFTSAPIWSGLFVTFILAFIMTMGLTMMMDIKTMDRFDDPKGKTIIINASE